MDQPFIKIQLLLRVYRCLFEAPYCGSEGYIDWFIGVIKDYGIDLVIPSFEEDVDFINEHRDYMELTGVKVVFNNFELINLCNDKWKFYKVLKRNNCPHVILSSLSSEFHELEREMLQK